MTNPPDTRFDWTLYADATLAGLSVLVPIPIVDSAFEWFFRRRMPGAVARRHGRRLDPAVAQALNRDDQGCLQSCLLLPITGTIYLVKRLSKKLLYFLTIKDASDRLSYYWHRAFLLDQALRAGHLEDLRSAQISRVALANALRTAEISPMVQLARRVVAGPGRIWASLRRARQGQEDATLRQKRTLLAQAWGDYAGDLLASHERYLQAHAQAAIDLAAAEAKAAAAEAAAQASGQAVRASRPPPE